MPGRYLILAVTLMPLLVCSAAPGGIPQPSCVLYGSILIFGQTIRAGDPVTVWAERPDGAVVTPVYHMRNPADSLGKPNIPAAGDDYVLRIRVENSLGGTLSPSAILLGQTATIYVQQGTGTKVSAGQVASAAAGWSRCRTSTSSADRATSPATARSTSTTCRYWHRTGTNHNDAPGRECRCGPVRYGSLSDLAPGMAASAVTVERTRS